MPHRVALPILLLFFVASSGYIQCSVYSPMSTDLNWLDLTKKVCSNKAQTLCLYDYQRWDEFPRLEAFFFWI